MQGASAGFRLAAIFERLQEIGASEAESTAAMILSGLGFDTEMQVGLHISFPILSGSAVQQPRCALW